MLNAKYAFHHDFKYITFNGYKSPDEIYDVELSQSDDYSHDKWIEKVCGVLKFLTETIYATLSLNAHKVTYTAHNRYTRYMQIFIQTPISDHEIITWRIGHFELNWCDKTHWVEHLYTIFSYLKHYTQRKVRTFLNWNLVNNCPSVLCTFGIEGVNGQ